MYTTESFCNYIWGQSYDNVRLAVDKSEYQSFKIPKKGGLRTINYVNSDSRLGVLQSRLNKQFLGQQVLPICAKGFVKEESYLSFLETHVGARYYLRVDIKSFFSSITEGMIRDCLTDIIVASKDSYKKEIIDLITNIVTLEGTLPQGACTSPGISNLVMTRIDQRITKYCQRLRVKYTRYADDLLFSSAYLDFREKKWFLRKVRYILNSKGLQLNYEKIKFGYDEIILNGFVVGKKGLRLSRNRLSDIRHVLAVIRDNQMLIENGQAEDFINILNQESLKYKDLSNTPFLSVKHIIQYLAGYRSFLISLLGYDCDESFRKENLRLIRKIEHHIDLLLLQQ